MGINNTTNTPKIEITMLSTRLLTNTGKFRNSHFKASLQILTGKQLYGEKR